MTHPTQRLRLPALAALLFAIALPGCKRDDAGASQSGGKGSLKFDKGVDVDKRTVSIGMLNAETGPAAIIGKPYAVAKRIIAAQINAGESGLLPDGWKIELVERDHQYNPQKSVQEYNAIKNKVLFVGCSFGTPNTMPLIPHLERDKLVAFPASLSSQLAAHENTPPLGPSYKVEAMRGIDFVVEGAGSAASVKAGIIYQNDDYGKDGLEGWKQAAAAQGVQIVSEQAISAGQKEFTAVVTSLKEAGATHVLLATLAGSTGPILGTAAQLSYSPVWLGNTPAWIDRFFDPTVLPPAVFANFYLISGFPFWGEDVPGMKAFIAAFDKHGKALHAPDYYILFSYLQGLIEVEALRRAIEAGDVTRAGYLKALRTIDKFDAGGMIQPINLTKLPYQVSTRTRVLKPDMTARSWKVEAPYASPKTPL